MSTKKQKIDLHWLEHCTLDDLKKAMRDKALFLAVNELLKTPEGKRIAGQMLEDPDYEPVSILDQREASVLAARKTDQLFGATGKDIGFAQHLRQDLPSYAVSTPPSAAQQLEVALCAIRKKEWDR